MQQVRELVRLPGVVLKGHVQRKVRGLPAKMPELQPKQVSELLKWRLGVRLQGGDPQDLYSKRLKKLIKVPGGVCSCEGVTLLQDPHIQHCADQLHYNIHRAEINREVL